MFSPYERMMAFRYLRARKAEGFVSIIATFSFLGIMLGVATLIIVMSVMNGFRAELVGRILGLNGHLNIYTVGAPYAGYYDAANKIRTLKGVKNVLPMIESQALLNAQGTAKGVMVRGLYTQDILARKVLAESLLAGSFESLDVHKVAIGIDMANKMNLHVGSKLTLTAPKGKPGPFGTIPRQRQYEIGAVFDVGMFEYNANFIFMGMDDARKIFSVPQNAVTFLEVHLADADLTDNMKDQIEILLNGDAGVYDWRNANKSFLNALAVERNVMFLILTLIIIVAAFNIISSMIMLVQDKAHDIAIMRTMGAGRNSILKIFVLVGAAIGIVGTICGALLGIGFALNIESIRQVLESMTGTELFAAEIYFLSQLPAEVEWHEVIGVVSMSLFLSILATLYPAWKAARMDPVEALRYV
ncbi:MAG: lipoprotein-releasing system transmembrane subunit LolC [Alphaproteobacteria bacterium]|nr:lipoprotein-releasing system transmembrane subunit LolC [Alphaproteobacteria bacterium]